MMENEKNPFEEASRHYQEAREKISVIDLSGRLDYYRSELSRATENKDEVRIKQLNEFIRIIKEKLAKLNSSSEPSEAQS